MTARMVRAGYCRSLEDRVSVQNHPKARPDVR